MEGADTVYCLSDFLCKGSVLEEITLKYSYGKDVFSY